MGNMVWAVDYGWSGGLIHTDLFLTEQDARKSYVGMPENWYKAIYQTEDIWGWVERQTRRLNMKNRIIEAIKANDRNTLEGLLAEAPKGTRIKLTHGKDRILYEKKAKTWYYARWDQDGLCYWLENQRPSAVAPGCIGTGWNVEVR